MASWNIPNNVGRGEARRGTSFGRGSGRSAGQGRGQPRDLTCYRCGQAGHIARLCPHGNAQRGRGRGQTSDNGRPGNPPADVGSVETVESATEAMDSMSLSQDLEGSAPVPQPAQASATSLSNVSPRASTHLPPNSPANPNDNDAPDMMDIPPSRWVPAEPGSKEAEEQKKAFREYYKRKGLDYDDENKMFLPRALHPLAENSVVRYASASDLPRLEEERLQKLADARARLAHAQEAPDGPDKADFVRKIEQQIRLLETPLEAWLPTNLSRAEDKALQCGPAADTVNQNSRGDTMHRFGEAFKTMGEVGALGTAKVPGPDGEPVETNRAWKNGDTWWPASDNEDEPDAPDTDWAEAGGPTSTFHGFIPRNERPHGIGLGHLGFDDVATKSRDGKWYTAGEVRHRNWNRQINAPLTLVDQDGTTVTIPALDPDNPCIEWKNHPKSLPDILDGKEAQIPAGNPPRRGGGQNRGGSSFRSSRRPTAW